MPWKDFEIRYKQLFILDQEIESSLKDPLVCSKYYRKWLKRNLSVVFILKM